MPWQTTGFEGLSEAVPDALLGVDSSGVIRFVNHQTESLFGYRPDDLVGVGLETLVPEALRQVHAAHQDGYDSATATRLRGTDLKLSGRRRDGTGFPVNVHLSPMDTGDGTLVIAAVRDLTPYRTDATGQRKAFEAAQRMAAIVEYSDDAIISSTPDGIITSWNPAAERLYGYPSEEIIGRSIQPVTPKDRAHEIEAILTKVRAGQSVEHFETMRVRKNGTVFPVSLTVSPIRDPGGAIDGVSVISRDITVQRQALESTERLAAIVEQSDDAIISRTLQDIITTWNPAAERLFGYSREEVIGQCASIIIPEGYDNELPEILARIKEGQPVVRLETNRLRRDGTEFPASLTVSPIRDADGLIVGVSMIARDVTEHKRTFESARSMIETSLESFVAISPEGRITDANEATVRATGVSRDKLIGTSFSEHFKDPEMAEELYQRVLTAGMAVDYPLTLRHCDGHETLTEVLYNASVYRDTRGKVVGVFAAARDVTQQKQAAQYARSLIEAALDPMVTISPEGQITDVNEATVRATGFPRDKLIGTSFSDYFTDPEKANEGYQRVFEQGSVTDYPLTLRHRDGHESFTEVLYNASLYRDTGGRVLGVFASARDVTKQLQAQREVARQQARELERLAELERFQRLTVGRELKMIELKKEIEYLRKSLPAAGGGEPIDQC